MAQHYGAEAPKPQTTSPGRSARSVIDAIETRNQAQHGGPGSAPSGSNFQTSMLRPHEMPGAGREVRNRLQDRFSNLKPTAQVIDQRIRTYAPRSGGVSGHVRQLSAPQFSGMKFADEDGGDPNEGVAPRILSVVPTGGMIRLDEDFQVLLPDGTVALGQEGDVFSDPGVIFLLETGGAKVSQFIPETEDENPNSIGSRARGAQGAQGQATIKLSTAIGIHKQAKAIADQQQAAIRLMEAKEAERVRTELEAEAKENERQQLEATTKVDEVEVKETK